MIISLIINMITFFRKKFHDGVFRLFVVHFDQNIFPRGSDEGVRPDVPAP